MLIIFVCFRQTDYHNDHIPSEDEGLNYLSNLNHVCNLLLLGKISETTRVRCFIVSQEIQWNYIVPEFILGL